ncbi:MAG: SAM-dependent methyltransferase [Casimicrobiaceae bacterium]
MASADPAGRKTRPPSGTLYLVPTLLAATAPEAALPARTLETAHRLRHFIAETPKTARAFLKAIGHPGPMAAIEITPVDPLPFALADAETWLSAGHDVGVVSDAGMPAIADPGAAIVARAHQLGARVRPLSGPSSILLALAASGLNGQRFEFLGYLPAKPRERDHAVRDAVARVRATGATQLFIETPYRHAPLLASLCELLPGDLILAAAQDLTGPTETIIAKPRAAWTPADRACVAERRPTLFLIGRAPELPASPR